jgi:hypothetical protein
LPAFIGAAVVCFTQQKLGYAPKTFAGNLSMSVAYFLGASVVDAVAQQVVNQHVDPAGAIFHGGLATAGSYGAFAAKNYICKK